jgi:protein gp37
VAARFSDLGAAYHGFADRGRSGSKWTGRVELVEKQLRLPLRWQKSRRIFVNSMSDLFHEALSFEVIDRVFAVMALAPRHTFQVLTKRPARMHDYIASRVDWLPLSNIWLGISVEDQSAWDERWPMLADTPAAVRFISFEPLIGPVDTRELLGVEWIYEAEIPHYSMPGAGDVLPDFWIIGGESGAGARPMKMAWARSLLEQCEWVNRAAWMKQTGSARGDDWPAGITGKGDDPSQWPQSLRVQDFPSAPCPTPAVAGR